MHCWNINKSHTHRGYILCSPDISVMLVFGLVSLRTAYKALALTNYHEARSPCRWPCILLSPWPWNFKARDLQKYGKCKKKHYEVELWEFEWVAFNRLMTGFDRFPGDYVTVVEDRPIMSVKYCLPVPVFHFWTKL